MKTVEIIRQSRIMRTGITALLLFLIATFAASWLIYGSRPVDKKAIGQFAEIIVPFGEYEEIYVVDGPAGAFLVKEEKGDALKLINTDGSLIADFAPMTLFVKQKGDLLLLKQEHEDLSLPFEQQRWDTYAVVNYTAMTAGKEYEPQHYSYVELHESGKYYAGRSADYSAWEMRTAEGEFIYERTDNPRFTFFTGEGLAVFRYANTEDERREITDVFTGEIIDTKEHFVTEGNGTIWICDSNNPLRSGESYVVDADFQPLSEMITGEGLRFSPDGKYLFGQLRVDSEDGKTVKAQNFVADMYGNIIYKGAQNGYFAYSEGDEEFVEITGDWLLVRQHLAEGKSRCSYVDLKTSSHVEISGEYGYCKPDPEPGQLLACVENKAANHNISSGLSDYVFNRNDRIRDSVTFDWLDWYYINENGQVCDFAFEGAYPAKDGYAAVRSEKKWGVIKFRDAV